MQATLARLYDLRSQEVEALLSYLRNLEQELSKNPLLERFGRKLDDLRIPLRVVPHEPIRDIEELRAREHFRQTGMINHGVDRDEDTRDQGSPRLYAFRGGARDNDQAKRSKPESLAQLWPTLQLAVLLGDPGSGKTEWLKYCARQAVREAIEKLKARAVRGDGVCLPIFVRLAHVEAALAPATALRKFLVQNGCMISGKTTLSDAERAAAALVKALFEHYALPPLLAPLVWQKLFPVQSAIRDRDTTSPALLCFDAWDEVHVPDEKLSELARCLHALAQVTPCRIVLTSRIVGYSQRPLPVESKTEGSRRELRLCPFEWSETDAFARSFFRNDSEPAQSMLTELRAKPNVAGMSQNPLLATLLCMAFAPNPHRPPLGFPARRVEVYKRVLEGLLGEWEATDKGVTPDQELIQAKLRLLEELAYRFFPAEALSQEGVYEFLWNKKTGYLTKLDAAHPLKRRLQRTPQVNLMSELCRDGVIVAVAEESWMFLHLTFQEYLTASMLSFRANVYGWNLVRAIVDRKSWSPLWWEVVVCMSGVLDDPRPLLLLLSDKRTDDIAAHRRSLAAVCLSETRNTFRQKHTDIETRIATAAFQAWAHRKFNTPQLGDALSALAQINGSIARHQWGSPVHFLELLSEELHSEWNAARAARAIAAMEPWSISDPTILRGLVLQSMNEARKERWDTDHALNDAIKAAMRNMSHVASEDPWVLSGLITLARYDPESDWLPYHEARALLKLMGRVGTAHATAIPQLLEILGSGNYECSFAEEILMAWGHQVVQHPDLIPAFIRYLTWEQESGAFWEFMKDCLKSAPAALSDLGRDLENLDTQEGFDTALFFLRNDEFMQLSNVIPEKCREVFSASLSGLIHFAYVATRHVNFSQAVAMVAINGLLDFVRGDTVRDYPSAIRSLVDLSLEHLLPVGLRELLAEYLDHPDENVALASAEGLWRLGADDHTGRLCGLLRRTWNQSVGEKRERLARFLYGLSTSNTWLVDLNPVVVEMLGEYDTRLRYWAARISSNIAACLREDRAALAALVHFCLEESDHENRCVGISALRKACDGSSQFQYVFSILTGVLDAKPEHHEKVVGILIEIVGCAGIHPSLLPVLCRLTACREQRSARAVGLRGLAAMVSFGEAHALDSLINALLEDENSWYLSLVEQCWPSSESIEQFSRNNWPKLLSLLDATQPNIRAFALGVIRGCGRLKAQSEAQRVITQRCFEEDASEVKVELLKWIADAEEGADPSPLLPYRLWTDPLSPGYQETDIGSPATSKNTPE